MQEKINKQTVLSLLVMVKLLREVLSRDGVSALIQVDVLFMPNVYWPILFIK